MKFRRIFILTVSSCLLLSGCTTPSDEAHVERLTRHRDWPEIQRVAEREVKKREIWWPDSSAYLPMEHEENIWSVTAMAGTTNGDAQRVVMLMIGDDGSVLAYKRYWQGHEVPELPSEPERFR